MPPDRADHQPRCFINRETADAGPECDQCQRAAAQLIGLAQRRPCRVLDDFRGGRPAKFHGGRMDDVARRHVAGRGLDGFAEPDRRFFA